MDPCDRSPPTLFPLQPLGLALAVISAGSSAGPGSRTDPYVSDKQESCLAVSTEKGT